MRALPTLNSGDLDSKTPGKRHVGIRIKLLMASCAKCGLQTTRSRLQVCKMSANPKTPNGGLSSKRLSNHPKNQFLVDPGSSRNGREAGPAGALLHALRPGQALVDELPSKASAIYGGQTRQ